MKISISATTLMRKENVELLVVQNWRKKDLVADIRTSARAGYLVPLFVLQFCSDRE